MDIQSIHWFIILFAKIIIMMNILVHVDTFSGE